MIGERHFREFLCGLLVAGGGALAQAPAPVDPPKFRAEPQVQPEAPPAPTINFNIEFRGATTFPEEELRSALEEQIGGIAQYGLNPARANDTAFFLALFYLRRGYSQVAVKEVISGNTLILNVDEGPLTTVGEVTFSGNTAIDSETLRTYLLGATRERVSRFVNEGELPFVEADIKTGVSRINGLYLSEGYLNVEIEKPDIDFSRDFKVATISIRIVQGTRYTIGNPQIVGLLDIFRDKDGDPIEEITKKYAGEPFTPQKIVNLRRSLVYEYKKKGYFQADAAQTADPANARDGVVPVVIAIKAGDQFRFDGAEFETEPDARLRRSFLENRFRPLSGKIYDPEELDELFRELMQTGLFTQLRISPEAIDGDLVKLNVNVKEAKAKELGFSIGYGTFEGPFVGANYTERNLFGTGRPFTVTTEFSSRSYRGEIRYDDPWFLETKNKLRLSMSAITYDFDSYSVFEVGALARISRDLTKHWNVAAFIRPRHSDVENSTIDREFLGPTSYLVSSVGLTSTIDYRDSPLNPHKGIVFSTAFELASSAVGSEIEFVRATYRFSAYHTAGPLLLAVGARGGIVSPSGGAEELPINERFFTGGSRSVRSFQERELGPKDNSGDPIGGETFQVYNAEVVFPLFGGFEGAAFVDAGSVGSPFVDGGGELRYGIGAGLRYPLPIGPLRLDYGVNPSPKKSESSGAFHFSFGFAF